MVVIDGMGGGGGGGESSVTEVYMSSRVSSNIYIKVSEAEIIQ